MSRFNLFSLFLLAVLSLSLVDAQQEARTKFVALERAQAEQRRLEIEWSKLQYEQSMLSKSARITELASSNLRMVVPSPNDIVYLSEPRGITQGERRDE